MKTGAQLHLGMLINRNVLRSWLGIEIIIEI